MSRKTKVKKTMDELLVEALVPEEEQPYEVPENWVWTKLGDYLNNHDNDRIPVSAKEREKLSGEVPYYGASGIIDYVNNFTHQGEFILIGEDGANLVTRSKPIAFIGRGKIWVNNHAHVLSCKRSFPNKFIVHYINSISLMGYISGSAQPKLSQRNLNRIPIPSPPLNEQKRIVNKVERLLNKIDQAKQLIKEAKETFELRRAAILDRAFRGEYSSQTKEVKFKEIQGVNCIVPYDWSFMSIEDICDLISDCPHSTPKYLEDGEYPAIRTSDVHFGKIDISKARRVSEKDYLERTRRTKPVKGDVIYCREGTVGNAGIIEDEEICLAQRVVLLRPDKTKVLPNYFVYVLNSPIMLRQVFSNISQTTSPRINISTLKKLILPIAPLDEQQNIINLIEKNIEIEQKSNFLIDQDVNLDNLKQSILSKAFRGELGTNDPTEESAIELLKEVLQEQIT